MNAFKAFKACTPIEWSPNIYITLVRGILGTRRLHRHTLEALRHGKCNRTVMQWNTPTVRGMLEQVLHFIARNDSLYWYMIVNPQHDLYSCQVKRLVVMETEEMYKARKQKEANHLASRPPFVINHCCTC